MVDTANLWQLYIASEVRYSFVYASRSRVLSAMRRSQYHILLYLNLLFLNLPQVLASLPQRLWQSSVYDEANDRILFLGGFSETGEITKEIYSLSLTKSFNRAETAIVRIANLSIPIADTATAITNEGDIYILGGSQSDCPTTAAMQVFDTKHDLCTINATTGSVPSSRHGARALMVQNEIFYFGGQSLHNCSANQYYYNSIYSLDNSTKNWTVRADTIPPVAQSRMTINAIGTNSFLLFGGEAVSSNSKATYVSASQLAVYNTSTSSWSYVSVLGTGSETMGRSGHTAVNNGTHTFVLGGTLGTIAASPNFLVLSGGSSSFTSTSLDNLTSGADSAPHNLYGHTATLTKNGIMIVATGIFGTSSNTTYNDQLYLYDTVHNQWLDSFDPELNVESPKIGKTIVGAILGTIGGLALLCTLALFVSRRRRTKIPGRNNMYEKGLAYLDSEIHGYEVRYNSHTPQMQSQLPPWAAVHACQARSKSPNPLRQFNQLHILEDHGNPQSRLSSEFNIQDIQFALPPTPRDMAFSAPQILLRITNPDTHTMAADREIELLGSTKVSVHRESSELIESEDELEKLRSVVFTGLARIDSREPRLDLDITSTVLPYVESRPVDHLAPILDASNSPESAYSLLALPGSNPAHVDLPEIITASSDQEFKKTDSPSSYTGSLRLSSYSPYLDSPISVYQAKSPRPDNSYNRLNRAPSTTTNDSQTSLLWWH